MMSWFYEDIMSNLESIPSLSSLLLYLLIYPSSVTARSEKLVLSLSHKLSNWLIHVNTPEIKINN